MEIKDREKYINLFDIYNALLTSKQSSYFEEYYYLDYSLQEIADNHGVSRNACYDAINKTCKILDNYETKMHLLEKNNNLKSALELNDINEIKNVIKDVVEE